MKTQNTQYQNFTTAQKIRHRIQKRSYHKTAFGYLMRTYANMQNRVKGRVTQSLFYKNKAICTKEEFYKFSSTSNFTQIFEAYEKSGFIRKLSPSINRIDSSRGYTLDNIQWLTTSDNTKRMHAERRLKKETLELLRAA